MLDDFTAKIPQSSFSNPAAISFPEINNYLQKYQDPRQADAIMRVQQELDETKIVLVCSNRTLAARQSGVADSCIDCAAQDNRVGP